MNAVTKSLRNFQRPTQPLCSAPTDTLFTEESGLQHTPCPVLPTMKMLTGSLGEIRHLFTRDFHRYKYAIEALQEHLEAFAYVYRTYVSNVGYCVHAQHPEPVGNEFLTMRIELERLSAEAEFIRQSLAGTVAIEKWAEYPWYQAYDPTLGPDEGTNDDGEYDNE